MKTMKIAFIAAAAFVLYAGTASAASLSLSPATGSATTGVPFTVQVLLDTQGASVSGVDIHFLRFNPALLQVQDASAAAEGIQISPGNLPGIPVANAVDNQKGQIDFSQIFPTDASFQGNGILASVTFLPLAAGTANAIFDYEINSTVDSNVANSGTDMLSAVVNGNYIIAAASSSSSSGGGSSSSSSSSSSTASSGGGGGGGGGSSSSTASGGGSSAATNNASTSSSGANAQNTATNSSTGTGASLGQSLVAGRLIKYADNPTVYIVSDGRQYPITRYEIYKRNFVNRPIAIVPASESYPAGEALRFGTGTLLKSPSSPAIWLVLDNNSRYGFRSLDEFQHFGYRLDLIEAVNDEELATYPQSAITQLRYHGNTNLVKYADNPTVYFIDHGIKRPLTSPAVFFSYADSWSTVLTIPADFDYQTGPALSFPDGMLLKGSGPAVWLIEGGYRRGFASATALTGRSYSFSQILQVADSDIDLNPQGQDIN